MDPGGGRGWRGGGDGVAGFVGRTGGWLGAVGVRRIFHEMSWNFPRPSFREMSALVGTRYQVTLQRSLPCVSSWNIPGAVYGGLNGGHRGRGVGWVGGRAHGLIALCRSYHSGCVRLNCFSVLFATPVFRRVRFFFFLFGVLTVVNAPVPGFGDACECIYVVLCVFFPCSVPPSR